MINISANTEINSSFPARSDNRETTNPAGGITITREILIKFDPMGGGEGEFGNMTTITGPEMIENHVETMLKVGL